MAQQQTGAPPLGSRAPAELDWRAEVKRRPWAWSLGALGVGLLAGCAISDARKQPRARGSRRPVAPVPAAKSEGPASVKGDAAPDPLRQELDNLRARVVAELSNLTQQVLLPAIIGGIREALVSDQSSSPADRLR